MALQTVPQSSPKRSRTLTNPAAVPSTGPVRRREFRRRAQSCRLAVSGRESPAGRSGAQRSLFATNPNSSNLAILHRRQYSTKRVSSTGRRCTTAMRSRNGAGADSGRVIALRVIALFDALRVELVLEADLIHKLGINREPLMQSDRPRRGVSPRVVNSHCDVEVAVIGPPESFLDSGG
jgi:hypothetical protein